MRHILLQKLIQDRQHDRNGFHELWKDIDLNTFMNKKGTIIPTFLHGYFEALNELTTVKALEPFI